MRRLVVFIAAIALFAFTGKSATATPQNHLVEESSPYLQLHKTDPVHWHPWTDAVLAEAKKAGKPILLSIGYTACHWCHVMQRESYANAETAAVINRLFFPILIDREERPDLDSLFQNAAFVMGLPGGWPLTMFLTPGAKPFFGGTYYPPEPRSGMLSFTQILQRVSQIYGEDPKGIAGQASKVTNILGSMSSAKPGEITPKLIDGAAETFLNMTDPLTGGFGEAPKFPQVEGMRLLWRAGLRTGEEKFTSAVKLSLDHMVRGGLYDHVGGGFFRYTVDGLWRVPHFEKMLDVNASLLSLMTEVWRETGDPVLASRIRETAAFLLSEMRIEGGAFAASLDADSLDANGEEEEGAFYIWSANEIDRVLGGKAKAFNTAFDIAATEGKNIDRPDDAGTLYMQEGAAERLDAFDASLAKLKRHRAQRHRPRIDDKVLADWNAMTIRALNEAGAAMGRKDWVKAAGDAFAFISKNLMTEKGELAHSWRGGSTSGPATLTDLGLMTDAAISLYETTGVGEYLKQARAFAKQAMDGHWDNKEGGFFASAPSAGSVLVRAKPFDDEPNASGNAVMIQALARLYYLGGEAAYRKRAERTLGAYGGMAKDPYLGISGLLNAADTLMTALQVVVVGRREEPKTGELVGQVMARSLPSRVLQVIKPGESLPDGHPAQYKEQLDGLPTAYVCRGTVCSLPATDRLTLDETLVQMR